VTESSIASQHRQCCYKRWLACSRYFTAVLALSI